MDWKILRRGKSVFPRAHSPLPKDRGTDTNGSQPLVNVAKLRPSFAQPLDNGNGAPQPGAAVKRPRLGHFGRGRARMKSAVARGRSPQAKNALLQSVYKRLLQEGISGLFCVQDGNLLGTDGGGHRGQPASHGPGVPTLRRCAGARLAHRSRTVTPIRVSQSAWKQSSNVLEYGRCPYSETVSGGLRSRRRFLCQGYSGFTEEI